MWRLTFRTPLRSVGLIRPRNVPKFPEITQTRTAGFMIPIVKGFGRIAAILLGRRIRTWWRELPQAKKDAYSKKLRGMKGTFYAVGGVMGVCGLSYYVSHLEKTPITGRRRFIMFKEADLQESIKEEKDAYMEAFSDSLVPRESNTYQYVKEIVQRLLSTRVTEKMESTHWKLYVVDKDIINAFVLPSGEIFMFTGMLKALKDKDEVAIILGHEIAHCLLHHGLEAVSHQGVLEIFSLGFITAIWAVVQSDILSYVVHKMQDGLMSMLFKYPHSRKVELEADEVGLMIAAKACFDPKAGPRIWDRFQQFSEDEIPEYLSTHPGHGRRSAYLTALLPNAYAISYSSNCAFLEGEAQQFRKKFRLL